MACSQKADPIRRPFLAFEPRAHPLSMAAVFPLRRGLVWAPPGPVKTLDGGPKT